MGISDILNLFRQGQGSARSHMKNLIEMAAVDGNFDDAEHDLLKKIARRNNISESRLKEIYRNPGKVQFVVPRDKQEKFHQLYELVMMMSADDSVHDEEMKLCNLYAVKFGYPRESSSEIIRSIQSNIKNAQPQKETFKRLEWMLN